MRHLSGSTSARSWPTRAAVEVVVTSATVLELVGS